MTAPWHDTPMCKRVFDDGKVCGMHRTALDCEGLAAGELRCCACGDDAPATPEELAQAHKSDAAYMREFHPEVNPEKYAAPVDPQPDDKTLPMFPVGAA